MKAFKLICYLRRYRSFRKFNIANNDLSRVLQFSSFNDPQHLSKSKEDDSKKEKINLLSVQDFVKSPIKYVNYAWFLTKDVVHHYWLGSKLLWKEIKLATSIINRVTTGHAMTRRERLQLIRTTMDIFRLVPFAIFVIVPFMEFLLPLALKLFPNMLPSTFQDKLKKEENMKKELQMRLGIAEFLQETLVEMANKKNSSLKSHSDAASAKEVIDFMEKAKMGEPLPNSQVLKIAKLFKDELTLANISRDHLITLCQYMGLKPFGSDGILRFRLRAKLRSIKEDDRRILWEGIESLTLDELEEACLERGMRSFGLNETLYRKQLQDWLDLSIQKSTPISLLIMSRAFSLTSNIEVSTGKLIKSISNMDEDVINEVVLSASRPSEENSVDFKKRRIESIEFQNELIDEEIKEENQAKLSKIKQSQNLQLTDKSKLAEETISNEASLNTSTNFPDSEIKTLPNDLNTQPNSLTLAEIEVLSDLARSSVVEREKLQLNIIKASIPENETENDSKIQLDPKMISIKDANFIKTLYNNMIKYSSDKTGLIFFYIIS